MNLRVLFVLENAGAGSGRHVIDLGRAYAARGHDVTLLYARHRLDDWFEREVASIASMKTGSIDMREGLSIVDISSVLALRRFLARQESFDVVHGHSSKGGAIARLATRVADSVRVYTPHALYTLGSAPGSARWRLFAALEKFLAGHCEGIICVSKAEREHAIEIGLPADKLFTVANGLSALPEASRQAVRERIGLRDDDIAVGFVGRLAPQKALHRLFEAFSGLRANNPKARLVIVGDGPHRSMLESRADRDGWAESVIWTGTANGAELMAAFDIFALSSRYEAMPYVLLEAAARALPIVSMRVGGVDELVHDGVNGVVVPQGDVGQFAAALTALAADGARREAMGAASARIVRDFGVDAMADQTLAVYTELLARGNTRVA